MLCFGVKNSHLRSFLGRKTWFLVVFGSIHIILGHFGLFCQFLAIFEIFCDIFAKPPCKTLVLDSMISTSVISVPHHGRIRRCIHALSPTDLPFVFPNQCSMRFLPVLALQNSAKLRGKQLLPANFSFSQGCNVI